MKIDMMNFSRSVNFTLVLLLAISRSSVAQSNWPEFRGPTGDGHVPEASQASLPTEFSKTKTASKNLKWAVPIHGKGWSSPVIWNEQIWLTTAAPDGRTMSVICAELETGKLVHDFVLYENESPAFCHPENSYASPTPAIEKGRVYVHFGSYGTAAIDSATGKVIWNRRDLECDHFRGPASSPILFENLLIVAFDGFDQQYVIALDKANGKTVWKTERDIDYQTENGDLKKAYGTASVFEIDGQSLLVCPSAIATEAFDPITGKRKWIVYHSGMNVSARPVLTGGGRVLLTNGMGQMVAVDPTGTGDITETGIAWKTSKTVPKKSSLLIVENRIYMVDDKGVMSCLDPETGKPVWQKRVGGTFAASPIYADGKIWFCSREGKVYLIHPGEEFDLVAENSLGKRGEGFWASPAVSGNRLILRSVTELYCVEVSFTGTR
jgi:outer membrane protein assembly factor BamB